MTSSTSSVLRAIWDVPQQVFVSAGAETLLREPFCFLLVYFFSFPIHFLFTQGDAVKSRGLGAPKSSSPWIAPLVPEELLGRAGRRQSLVQAEPWQRCPALWHSATWSCVGPCHCCQRGGSPAWFPGFATRCLLLPASASSPSLLEQNFRGETRAALLSPSVVCAGSGATPSPATAALCCTQFSVLACFCLP